MSIMSCKVKAIRCDRGSEYLNKDFLDFCSSKGITLNPSPAYVHELNETAERYNRTIMNRTRCLLSDPDCLNVTAYLANTKAEKSPFEIFFG